MVLICRIYLWKVVDHVDFGDFLAELLQRLQNSYRKFRLFRNYVRKQNRRFFGKEIPLSNAKAHRFRGAPVQTYLYFQPSKVPFSIAVIIATRLS